MGEPVEGVSIVNKIATGVKEISSVLPSVPPPLPPLHTSCRDSRAPADAAALGLKSAQAAGCFFIPGLSFFHIFALLLPFLSFVANTCGHLHPHRDSLRLQHFQCLNRF